MDEIRAWTTLYDLQDRMPGASPDRLAGPISEAMQKHPVGSPAALRAVVEATWRPGYEYGAAIAHAATVETFQDEAFNAMSRLATASQRTGVYDFDASSMLWAVVQSATTVGRAGSHDQPGPPRSRAYGAVRDAHPDLSPLAAAAVSGWKHGQRQGRQDAPYSASRAIYDQVKDKVDRAQIDGRSAALWFDEVTADALEAATHASTDPPRGTGAFRPLSVDHAATRVAQPLAPVRAPAAPRRGR